MTGYTLPDKHTLKNSVGATTPSELDALEGPLVAFRFLEIQMGGGPTGDFDLDRFRATHRHLFQDVYAWAGRTRDERVLLPDGVTATEPQIRKIDGVPFATGPQIPNGLLQVFRRLAAEDGLGGLPRIEFAIRAAGYFAQINTIHAFREGNGRTQRTFFEALAKTASHTLDFDVVSRERMIVASIDAHELGDVSGFARMFREISDPERVAALREAQQFLDSQKFPSRDRYMATTEEGRTYALTMVGRSGPHFIAHTREGDVGRSRDLPEPVPPRGSQVTMTAEPEVYRQAQPDPQEDASRDAERARPRMRPRKG